MSNVKNLQKTLSKIHIGAVVKYKTIWEVFMLVHWHTTIETYEWHALDNVGSDLLQQVQLGVGC